MEEATLAKILSSDTGIKLIFDHDNGVSHELTTYRRNDGIDLEESICYGRVIKRTTYRFEVPALRPDSPSVKNVRLAEICINVNNDDEDGSRNKTFENLANGKVKVTTVTTDHYGTVSERVKTSPISKCRDLRSARKMINWAASSDRLDDAGQKLFCNLSKKMDSQITTGKENRTR